MAPDVGAACAASITFPADYLRSPKPTGEPKKPVLIFGDAPPGEAVEFGFFYSREPAETLEPKLEEIGRPLFRTTLDNGDSVSMVARVKAFDVATIPSIERLQSSLKPLVERDELRASTASDNLTMMMWNDPGDGGQLQVIEIGGLKVSLQD